MAVGKLVQFDSEGNLRRLMDWCLYAAFTVPADGKSVVKIGISQNPLRRIYDVHCGSAYPVEMALWCYIGSKARGLSIERTIRARMEEFRTRGEWYAFDTTSPEHKAIFHASCKAAFLSVTGRNLEWKKTTVDDAKAALGITFEEGLTRKRR